MKREGAEARLGRMQATGVRVAGCVHVAKGLSSSLDAVLVFLEFTVADCGITPIPPIPPPTDSQDIFDTPSEALMRFEDMNHAN